MPITVIGNAYNYYYSAPSERIFLKNTKSVEVVGNNDMLKIKLLG